MENIPKQLEVERIVNVAVAFGWKKLEDSLSDDGTLRLTLIKRPAEDTSA